MSKIGSHLIFAITNYAISKNNLSSSVITLVIMGEQYLESLDEIWLYLKQN